MRDYKNNIGNFFLVLALLMLLLGLLFGVFSSVTYLFPSFGKRYLGFSSLRPLHVTSAIFWIIIGATGCVYNGLRLLPHKKLPYRFPMLQLGLWIFAIIGILVSYITGEFGGREYWEFNPKWALPIVLAWLLFLVNFSSVVRQIKNWPVYIWMWMTGIVFFLFTFLENYLWVFPYFRSHFITDMTIQWKVSGSLVGSWNQIIYGTVFFLMDRMTNSQQTGRSKLAFSLYFLGLFNLMFNWGHHIYTLPTASYVRYVAYIVSMTEWVFFIKIIIEWRKTISTSQKNYHYFPYRFIMATDFWIFVNMGQALIMSIPVLNLYTHGTHVTVAHAMGTTIGINTMILLAACFEFLKPNDKSFYTPSRMLNGAFWTLQICLFFFWLSLDIAGIKKGIWQLSIKQQSFSEMMLTLRPYFIVFAIAGFGLFLAISFLAVKLLRSAFNMMIPPR